jgi:hypothetical protein
MEITLSGFNWSNITLDILYNNNNLFNFKQDQDLKFQGVITTIIRVQNLRTL